MLLRTIYDHAYKLENAAELLKIVELADYYQILPVLSRRLDGIMYASSNFCTEIRENCIDLFVTAAKLRNPLLFRECLIWVVGTHNIPEFHHLEDKHLQLIATSVHGETSAMIMFVLQKILVQLSDDRNDGFSGALDKKLLSGVNYGTDCDDESFDIPRYFRKLKEDGVDIDDRLYVNNLKLERANFSAGLECKDLKGKVVDLEGHFLCAKISDEDLPWNTKNSIGKCVRYDLMEFFSVIGKLLTDSSHTLPRGLAC